MSTYNLIVKLIELGITIQLVNDKLKITGPEEKLTSTIIDELRTRKEEILKYFKEKTNVLIKGEYKMIKPSEKKENYKLSSIQKRIHFLQQMKLNSINYNIPYILHLNVNLNIKKLEDTFTKLILRHESLRTSFEIINEETAQIIHNEAKLKVQNYELSPNGSKVEIAKIIKNFVHPFDLSKVPLLHIGIIQAEPMAQILMVDMHHIISDGLSQNVLISDFMSIYNEIHLPLLRLQYKDYSEWQQSESVKKILKRQEEFWIKEFEGEIPILSLPTDYPRPLIQSFEGKTIEFELNANDSKKLIGIKPADGGTTFMVMMSIFNILLAKLSNQDDIVVGFAIAGRRHADLHKIVGVFINTLAMRNHPVGEKSFLQFLNEVKEKTLNILENQDYPFEDLVEKVVVQRDMSRNPIFDVLCSSQNYSDVMKSEVLGNKTSRNLRTTPYSYENKTAKFDMTLNSAEKEGKLAFSLIYCTKLFKEETIVRFIRYFKKIISSIIEDPMQMLSAIEIMEAEEKKQVLEKFNNTNVSIPLDKTVLQIFQEQVGKTPSNVAVVGRAGGAKKLSVQTGTEINIDPKYSWQITYQDLNEKANRLAFLLREKGTAAGTIVAIMVEPSVEMIIAIMAVLKSGGCYLPIEPHQPKNRISYMLIDSQASLLITFPQLAESISYTGQILCMNDPLIYAEPGENILNINHSKDLVYIIYTSGTTGKSKGVLIEHGNLVNYINWFQVIANLTDQDRTMLTSSFGFDLGYTSIFPPILSGSQLHLIPKEYYMSPGKLIEYARQNRITYLKMTPSLFTTIVESTAFSNENFQYLRIILLGGEQIITKDVKKMHEISPHIEIINHYGPTETTIGCVAQKIDFVQFDQYEIRPTIGSPIFNTNITFYDKGLKLVPIDVRGELCVAGAGVGRGYLNQQELTQEKFCSHPDLKGKRIYRTGDMARLRDGAIIEFIGRSDNQVKIRGYRVEINEIENCLLSYDEIKNSAVVVNKRESGDMYICAYIEWKEELHRENNRSNKLTNLKEFISLKLPGYMIPSYFVQLAAIPITPNGKVDRKMLPAVDDSTLFTENIGPRDEFEEKLRQIWSEILEIENESISITHDFFELGGNSLNLIKQISKIKKEFGVALSINQIYNSPSIKDIVVCIKLRKNVEEPMILLNKQSGKTMFGFPSGTGFAIAYQKFAGFIDDYSIYSFNFIEDENRVKLYSDIITGVQPVGPYILFGWSAAGKIIFEVTKALENQGHLLTDIILFDGYYDQTRVFGDAELQFMGEVEKYVVESGLEYLRDSIKTKTEKYLRYVRTLKDIEVVNANVHLIISEEIQRNERQDVDIKCWDNFTTKKVVIYNGFGSHYQMLLNNGIVEKNVEIFKGILGRLEKSYKYKN